jgi:aminoglycoside phosphotransferase (APT) family kinase protein
MSFASAYTRIPVPKIHRVRNIEHDNGYWGTTCFIVMDYVQGVCLATSWASLDVASRSDVTSQVAAIVQELGSITLPDPPGPTGGTRSRFRGA